MKLHIKNGHLIDPKNKKDGKFDLVIDGNQIADVLKPGQKVEGAKVIDAQGLIVAPGFIDLHTHLREPGFEYKETIQTGTKSAAAGGFTSICCMANTQPVNDNASVTELILNKAKEEGIVNVYPIGAVTRGLEGKELAPMGELKNAGCVAVSDDGKMVQDNKMMRLAMEYAKGLGLPVISHAVCNSLGINGVMNEGIVSTRLGLNGIPNAAEDVIVSRDIHLAELTGVHVHIAHLTTAGGVEEVRKAKKRGIKATCEVTPHHFTLTDEAVSNYDTNTKMMPPLRAQKDLEALIEAMEEGVIDAIATDHAPHAPVNKQVEYDQADFGIVGLETALSLSLQLVEKKKLSIKKMIELLTVNPANIVSLRKGSLEKGADADVVLFDPHQSITIDPSKFKSKSKNTPFGGMKVKGVVKYTIVGGKVVYRRS